MRFYMNQLKYFCCIDLHARTMYMCILDHAGTIVSQQAVRTRSAHYLKTLVLNRNTLALVMVYELHDIDRLPRVQDFASSCRLVECAKESAGKRYGTSGKKIGNTHLKRDFSEAALLFLRKNPAGQKYYAKLERKHGKGKAVSVLAHEPARAAYYMLKRQEAFDMKTFLNSSWRGTGEPGVSLEPQGESLHGACS